MNSFGLTRQQAWKDATDGFTSIIERLRRIFRIVSMRWNRFLLSVICGCNAGLLRQALHEVYILRIQRGDIYFAANVLGARATLLSVLAHFFKQGYWGSLLEMGVERAESLFRRPSFILMQAGLYLTLTRGHQAPEARICYESAEPLCRSLKRPALLYLALMGQWRYSLIRLTS